MKDKKTCKCGHFEEDHDPKYGCSRCACEAYQDR
jgi:hypothetical protein